jgi:hypothetical protein
VSPAASAALLSIGFSLLLIQISVGFRRFNAGLMPLGANCSAAISAAGHTHPLDTDAASRLVQPLFREFYMRELEGDQKKQ